MKRVVILFVVKQVLLLGVLYLVLDFFPDATIDGNLNEDKRIRIVSGDTHNQKLRLTPSTTVPVFAKKHVTWSCKNSDNVESFEIIPKGSPEDVFEESGPLRGNRNNDVKRKLKDRDNETIYEYSIIWFDTMGGGPYTHDPKIAIKPGDGLVNFLIYFAYGLLAVLISYLTFRKR